MSSSLAVQRTFQLIAVLAVIATLSSCGRPLYEQALREFRAAHPDATVQEQFVGEGDFDHAYMHFRYTTPASAERLEQMWMYQRQKDNSWRAIHKIGPKSPGSDFGD
jgi:hypothetical protein